MVIFLSFLLLVTTFFPYVRFYPFDFGTDIQPWNLICVLMMMIVLIVSKVEYDKVLALLLFPLGYSLFLVITRSCGHLNGLRSVAGYVLIALSPIAYQYIIANHRIMFEKLLKSAVVIYLLVGILQLIFGRYIFAIFLNRISTSAERGVSSLTPEPTFYGLVCLFLMLLFLLLNIRNKEIYIILLLFQILFLAQSTTAVLYLLLWLLCWGIALLLVRLKNRFWLVFRAGIVILLLLFLTYIVVSYMDLYVSMKSRLIYLLSKLFKSSYNVFYVDGSANDRLAHLYYSIKGFLMYPLGHGFGHFASFLVRELPKQSFFWHVSLSDRIMSYYGSILFEIGMTGILIPVVYSWFIIKAYYESENLERMVLYLLFFNALLFVAIPLSFPLVGCCVGVFIYLANQSKIFKKERGLMVVPLMVYNKAWKYDGKRESDNCR